MSIEDTIDWSKHNYRSIPTLKKREYHIDKEVSKIVGKKVLQNDPKLAKLCMKWRGSKPVDGKETPDNHLKDERKIKELKRTFS